MAERVLLDTGLLGEATHPRPSREFTAWLSGLLSSSVEVVIPEIADYELRRELMRSYLKNGEKEGLDRLERLKAQVTYLPINTNAMQLAAKLWAEARNRGRATAHPEALDGDVILAAQARLAGGTVATENVGHLSQFVDARSWREI